MDEKRAVRQENSWDEVTRLQVASISTNGIKAVVFWSLFKAFFSQFWEKKKKKKKKRRY